MSANPWHRRYHSDALAGMLALTLEERGAYQTVLDLIYDAGGPIADNERLLAGYMGCSIRKWRTLREALVIKGKLASVDGRLTNSRAEKEIENNAKTSRKRAENGLKGARKKIENQKNDNENKESDENLPEQNSGLLPEARSQKPEEEDKNLPQRAPARGGKEYAFAGDTIRLVADDLERWRKAYHAIPDIAAELWGLEDWFRINPDRKADWFQITSRSLGRKHQKYLSESRPAPTPEYVPMKSEYTPEDIAAAKQRLIERGELQA